MNQFDITIVTEKSVSILHCLYKQTSTKTIAKIEKPSEKVVNLKTKTS